jgi:hypothetical protein
VAVGELMSAVPSDARMLEAGGPWMIQFVYKGVEIELVLHQQTHQRWKCDYTLITHPNRTRTLHPGGQIFPTMDLARDAALQEARDAIDRSCNRWSALTAFSSVLGCFRYGR